MADVFLLSPAWCGGKRAHMLLREGAEMALARDLREGRLTLGAAFSFMSGLYFRGKLTYASAFAADESATWVITPTRGLQPPSLVVSTELLKEFAGVDVDPDDPRYRAALERDARALAARLGGNDNTARLGPAQTRPGPDQTRPGPEQAHPGPDQTRPGPEQARPGPDETGAGPDNTARVVLLGSIATGKYVDVLRPIFGDRLHYPADFVSRGDMSRGGLMLRCARERVQLRYVKVTSARPRSVKKVPPIRLLRLTSGPRA